MKALSKELNIPTLEGAGVTKEKFPELAQAIMDEKGSLSTNPRELKLEEILEMLEIMY